MKCSANMCCLNFVQILFVTVSARLCNKIIQDTRKSREPKLVYWLSVWFVVIYRFWITFNLNEIVHSWNFLFQFSILTIMNIQGNIRWFNYIIPNGVKWLYCLYGYICMCLSQIAYRESCSHAARPFWQVGSVLIFLSLAPSTNAVIK